jgi:hypothetical protein
MTESLSIDENPYPRAGIRPAEVSRAAFVTIADRKGYLYAVDLLVPNRPQMDGQDFLSANRSGILFWLGIKFLWWGLLAIPGQARIHLGTRLRRQ